MYVVQIEKGEAKIPYFLKIIQKLKANNGFV